MTSSSPAYCTDPEAALDGIGFVDTLTPCPELTYTVPVNLAVLITVSTLVTVVRKCMMRRAGLDEPDIRAIMLSRKKRNNNRYNSSFYQDDDDCNEKQNETSADEESLEEAVSTDTKETQQPTKTGDSETPLFCLSSLIEKYGDKKLRVLDSVPRKMGHFLNITLTLVQLELMTNTFVLQGQTAILAGVIWSFYNIFLVNYFSDSCFAVFLFGGAARVRDGKMGRGNLVISATVTTLGVFVVYVIGFFGLSTHLDDSSLQKLLGAIVYVPLSLGDALGELIGGPFGGTFFPTFPVKGFGEINRKSIEGCLSVFCGSLVGCIGLCLMYGANSSDWMVLCLILAVVTTMVETVAFRSTDNFFIPVCNVAVMTLAFQLGYGNQI